MRVYSPPVPCMRLVSGKRTLFDHLLAMSDGFSFRLECFETLDAFFLPCGNPSVVAVLAYSSGS